jgi:hypothetical protein
MKTKICLLVFVLVTSVASCVATHNIKPEDDIREVTFRYQFSPWLRQIPEQELGRMIFFLAVGENKEDPGKEFMGRFINNKPAVKTRSHATGGLQGVKDRDTGQPGVIFYVSKIKWLKETEVEVEGAYFGHGQSSSRSTYTLAKKNDKWVVMKEAPH